MTDINKLIVRLYELSQAAANGRWSEFSMRVPADFEHDADLVLQTAANELQRLDSALREHMQLTRDAVAMCDALRAQLREIESAPVRQPIRWRPISEAPKGREVVVWVPRHGIASAHLYVDEWVGLIPPEPRPTHFAEIVGPGGEPC